MTIEDSHQCPDISEEAFGHVLESVRMHWRGECEDSPAWNIGDCFSLIHALVHEVLDAFPADKQMGEFNDFVREMRRCIKSSVRTETEQIDRVKKIVEGH